MSVDSLPPTMPRSTGGPSMRPAVSALPAYVPGCRGAGDAMVALASNESHYDPLPSVLREVIGAAERLNRYPDMGSLALRERLADHLSASVDEVAVGPGSVGVLSQIISAFCGLGDEVVFAWRSFEAYPLLVKLAGARAVPVPLRQDEGHDLPGMLAAITERTRVIIVCTPNNPTGVPVSHTELEQFLQGVPPEVLVVIDEAYVEYATAPDSPDSLALYRRHPNVCVLRTFSKAYGLAGLRVGYALAAPHLAEGLRKTAIPFAVSALAQQAAISSLDAEHEMRARAKVVVQERERLTAALRRYGWDVPESEANFLWLRTEDPARERLVEAFAAAGILVRGYPGDGVRISLAAAAANDRVLTVLADETLRPQL